MDETARSAWWHRWTSWLGLALGVGVVAGMVRHAGAASIVATLQIAGAGVLWVLLVPLVSTVLHVAGWRALIPPEQRAPWATDLARFEAAQAWNEVGFSVLGEPLKVWGSPPEHREEALGVLLLDNLAQLLTTATFLVVGALALAPLVGAAIWPGAVSGRALAIGAVFVLVVVAALFVARRRGAGVPASVRKTAQAAWTHARIAPGEVLRCYLLHLAGKLWMVVELAVALAVVGSPRLAAAPALAFASTLGSLVGAPIPGQIGSVEGFVGLAGQLLAVPLEICVAVLLLRRVRTVLRVIIGLALAKKLVSPNPGWLGRVATIAAR